jgi:hypothetical protein
VEYLGHIVSHEGVKLDPNKIKYINECTIPKTLKKLREFLGLIGYYHKFFKNCGQIAATLKLLLNKESFFWTQTTTKYFEKLKEAMCITLVLATPNFTKTFIIENDASDNGISVVLMQ